ncbi:hypothetical protein [Selenomonas ruminantium]|uniref:hypothetical protein n=1 Tax=Selenomonas ruminantium TaxID=971 RepID=UPI0026EE30CE|nr:hypothetical protein [Selenomonas ruminantium]
MYDDEYYDQEAAEEAMLMTPIWFEQKEMEKSDLYARLREGERITYELDTIMGTSDIGWIKERGEVASREGRECQANIKRLDPKKGELLSFSKEEFVPNRYIPFRYKNCVIGYRFFDALGWENYSPCIIGELIKECSYIFFVIDEVYPLTSKKTIVEQLYGVKVRLNYDKELAFKEKKAADEERERLRIEEQRIFNEKTDGGIFDIDKIDCMLAILNNDYDCYPLIDQIPGEKPPYHDKIRALNTYKNACEMQPREDEELTYDEVTMSHLDKYFIFYLKGKPVDFIRRDLYDLTHEFLYVCKEDLKITVSDYNEEILYINIQFRISEEEIKKKYCDFFKKVSKKRSGWSRVYRSCYGWLI